MGCERLRHSSAFLIYDTARQISGKSTLQARADRRKLRHPVPTSSGRSSRFSVNSGNPGSARIQWLMSTIVTATRRADCPPFTPANSVPHLGCSCGRRNPAILVFQYSQKREMSRVRRAPSVAGGRADSYEAHVLTRLFPLRLRCAGYHDQFPSPSPTAIYRFIS